MLAATFVLAGCADLGLPGDNGSLSYGRVSGGLLLRGARLPDHGPGFTTRDVWRQRNNRYGTDELIELIAAVAFRLHARAGGADLVVADLSARAGGGDGAAAFHRSHQSGRDCDLVYFTRDAKGNPHAEATMRIFDADGKARDGSGDSIDVARQWLLVRELLTAPEANVQWLFMYEPIAEKVIARAVELEEPPALIARARATLRQPGDSARHDDHMHVRVYCTAADREAGCIDIGPLERLDREGLVARTALPGELTTALRHVAKLR